MKIRKNIFLSILLGSIFLFSNIVQASINLGICDNSNDACGGMGYNKECLGGFYSVFSSHSCANIFEIHQAHVSLFILGMVFVIVIGIGSYLFFKKSKINSL